MRPTRTLALVFVSSLELFLRSLHQSTYRSADMIFLSNSPLNYNAGPAELESGWATAQS